MKILKFFVLPVLAGMIAGAFALWCIDGMPSPTAKYFFNAAGKSFFPSFIASLFILMFFKRRDKKTDA